LTSSLGLWYVFIEKQYIESMAIESQELRRILGHFATGVTVITTKDDAGSPFGLTANAFTSLSLNPPLILICVDKGAQCYSCFVESNVFTVNFLHEDQEDISRRFATKGADKFAGLSWHEGSHGAAVLDGAIGHLECKIVQSYDGGDHTIIVGEVLHGVASHDRPLLFFRGKYHRMPNS
jgi:flavin reductase (DIM6/NTAB) family NADH-FMN oxidoreductase RutF